MIVADSHAEAGVTEGAASISLFSAFRQSAAEFPDTELTLALETEVVRISLSEVVARGERLAGGLDRLGLRQGDVIAVQLPACVEWILLCVAVARIGGVLLPAIPSLGARDLGFILKESSARMLVTRPSWRGVPCADLVAEAGDLPPSMQHLVTGVAPDRRVIGWDAIEGETPPANEPAIRPDDVALLLYTSGTTSDPKGALHSQAAVLAEVRSVKAFKAQWPAGPTLSPWPPGHMAGTLSMLRFLINASPTVLLEKWDAERCAALIETEQVIATTTTPFHLASLLDAADRTDHDISSLKDIQCGSAPVSPALVERCAVRGLTTYRSYGSTEHPTVTYGSIFDPLEKRLTTEGRLMPGVELRTCDDDGILLPLGAEGEIVTRGPDMFSGYVKASLDSEAFLPGGWYRTGDIGCLDDEGYLIITDRKKDIIIRGGENISSREVEDVLGAHPDIAEASVVAAKDIRMGEIVCAFIVERPGRSVALADLASFFAAQGLARHKTPERLVKVGALPRNPTGKVLKAELRARLEAISS